MFRVRSLVALAALTTCIANVYADEAVVLFSPSSVESLAQRVDGPEHHPVYAIGAKTAAAARQCGFPVRATLAEPTPQALLDCFTNHDRTS